MDFYAAWCMPCKVLEESVFPDRRVRKALEGYEMVRVDTDEFPEAGKVYGISSLPSILILDTSGRVLDRLDGAIDAVRLEKSLRAATEAPERPR